MKKILLSLLILVPLSGFSFLCSDDDKIYNQEYLDKPAGLLGYWGEDKVLHKVKELAKNDLESVNKSKVTITSIRLMEPYCSHDEYYVPKGYKYSDIKMVYEVSFYFSDFPDIRDAAFQLYVTEINSGKLFITSENLLIGIITSAKSKRYIISTIVGKYFNSYSGYLDDTLEQSTQKVDKLDNFNFNNLDVVYSKPQEIVKKLRKYPYLYKANITIYNTPKTAENLAKAIQMSKELYNFLYDLSASHRVGYIEIDLFSVDKEEYLKESKLDKALKAPSFWGEIAFQGCSNIKSKDTKLCEEELNSFEPIISGVYIDPYKTMIDFKLKDKYLTQTKLYPAVTKILKEEK